MATYLCNVVITYIKASGIRKERLLMLLMLLMPIQLIALNIRHHEWLRMHTDQENAYYTLITQLGLICPTWSSLNTKFQVESMTEYLFKNPSRRWVPGCTRLVGWMGGMQWRCAFAMASHGSVDPWLLRQNTASGRDSPWRSSASC